MSGRDAGNRRAVVSVASDVTVLLLTIFLIVSRLFYKQLGMTRSFEFDRVALLGLMAALMAVRFAPISTRAGLAAWAVLASSSLTLAVLLILNLPVADIVKNGAIAIAYGTHTPAAIFQHDERYGYLLRPNTQDIEKLPDFNVTYTVGADGHRIMPVPEHARATVVFLGDWYTFGTGVGDRETYLHVLASEFWRDVHVVNTALPGWGVTQMVLTAMDTLAGSSLPAMIVAALVRDDPYRSYLRTPVTEGVKRRLEYVDGELVMRETDRTRALPPMTPELVEQELGMNLDLIREMHQAATAKGVACAVVLFADSSSYPAKFIYGLGTSQIPTID